MAGTAARDIRVGRGFDFSRYKIVWILDAKAIAQETNFQLTVFFAAAALTRRTHLRFNRICAKLDYLKRVIAKKKNVVMLTKIVN